MTAAGTTAMMMTTTTTTNVAVMLTAVVEERRSAVPPTEAQECARSRRTRSAKAQAEAVALVARLVHRQCNDECRLAQILGRTSPSQDPGTHPRHRRFDERADLVYWPGLSLSIGREQHRPRLGQPSPGAAMIGSG